MSPADHIGPAYRNIERWVAHQLGTIEHERHVARIALRLIELTSAKQHLDARHRRLLLLGAIVHDVGRCRNDERHPQVGAKMIESADELPLSKGDRRALCYLTRYHRGAVPRMGNDDYLKVQDDRKQLYLAMAFLRAADSLDNRSMESPRLAIRFGNGRLVIKVHLAEDSAKARRIYRRRRKFKLLEELLGVSVRVETVHSVNVG